MPSRWTFSISPIASLLDEVLAGCKVVVDPFCGRSTLATHRNDLAETGLTANEWLDGLIADGIRADAVILDPPYSPRQISECYAGIGRKATTKDTQNSKLYADAIERLDKLLIPGGAAVRCGWNSVGFGKTRGYAMERILMVSHGGAHNDTIVTVERKGVEQCRLK